MEIGTWLAEEKGRAPGGPRVGIVLFRPIRASVRVLPADDLWERVPSRLMHPQTQWATQPSTPPKKRQLSAGAVIFILCIAASLLILGVVAFAVAARDRFPAHPAAAASTPASAVPTPDARQREAYLKVLAMPKRRFWSASTGDPLSRQGSNS
ncbi:hypothetical protein [Sphaerisporangium rhizosphaerae]|uniref:Uncharacterized protein n=1 Tax=Sphaerisporangium rhizosphaerae TaxID=2269375 RepID=A0ABW2NYB4_9ACTN